MQMNTPRQAFDAMVRDHGPDLPLDVGVALIAADEQPDVDVGSLVAQLDRLADRITLREEAPLFDSIARLHMFLFADQAFRGDEEDYTHPRNSYLNRVLEHQRGMPILLGVVYMEVARRLGLDVDGISYPGHFLVSPHDGENRLYVDPFHQGRIVTQEQLRDRLVKQMGEQSASEAWSRCSRGSSATAIMVRINNNLKRSWAERGELDGALRAVERNLILVPDYFEEQRDRGMILAELGRVDEAIEQLERYLRSETSVWDQARVTAIIDILRRR